MNCSAPDLTVHPPRSPRVRLGGYVHFPRLLDKARAHAAGRLGAYLWNCPLDHRFFAFTGVSPEALLAAVQEGRGDSAMLAWLQAASPTPRAPWEIRAWSDWLSSLAAGSAARHKMFAGELAEHAPEREDIVTYFDRLDLDDYVSFGGRA